MQKPLRMARTPSRARNGGFPKSMEGSRPRRPRLTGFCMSLDRQKPMKQTRPQTQRSSLFKRLQISKRLTPKERQALALVLGLFLLGAMVRWYRLTHLR